MRCTVLPTLLAATAILCTNAPTASAVTSRDKDIVDTCLMMSTDAMVNDTVCRDLMRRWNVTTADMVMMKACRAMSMEEIDKDADCDGIRRKHPDIVAAALER